MTIAALNVWGQAYAVGGKGVLYSNFFVPQPMWTEMQIMSLTSGYLELKGLAGACSF